jgi:hypothetical protein
MGAKKDFSCAIPLHIPYKNRQCPACGNEQRYGYCSSGRHIFRLDALFRVTSQVVYCVTPRCPLIKQDMHPPEEWALAPPYKGFGSDVIAEAGRLRFSERMTRVEIKNDLKAKYSLDISEREVNTLYDLYGALVSGATLEDSSLIAAVKRNRALVISLDGAEPMLGHETVWFVRDLITGRTLLAAPLRSKTTDDLVRLLTPVREFANRLGVPLAGVVSDGESSVRKAVKKVWPRVRHQLCQIHFVKRLAKELIDDDRNLRKELRKPFRSLREVERTISKSVKAGVGTTRAQADVLLDVCLVIRSILRDDGKPPFQPPGLKLFERLTELRAKIGEMRREKGGPAFDRSRSFSPSWTGSEIKSATCGRTMRTSGPWGTSCSQREERPKVSGGSCGRWFRTGRRDSAAWSAKERIGSRACWLSGSSRPNPTGRGSSTVTQIPVSPAPTTTPSSSS